MSGDGLRLLLPRPVRELPADLVAVLALVAATVLVAFLPPLDDSPIRVVVGLVFVLFVPGYAFVAMLFPEAGDPPTAWDADAPYVDDENDGENDGERNGQKNGQKNGQREKNGDAGADPAAGAGRPGDRGIDGVERVALSFGLSIAIAPLLLLALNFTPFGIRLVPIVVTLGGFTVVATAVAAWRRWQLPAAQRFRVPYRSWLAETRRELFDPPTRLDAALNVALVLAILLATSSVVYAIAVPPQGEQFTEFYLLTESEDGDLVADGYPESLTAGQAESLYVGIGNHERETVEYEVVVQLQRVEVVGNESRVTANESLDRPANASQVTARERVDSFSATVADNETWLRQRNLTVDGDLTGEDLRLTYLLYVDGVPETPTRENAYRDLHLWVDVEA